MELSEYGSMVVRLGYAMRTKRCSEFHTVTYYKGKEELPVGKGILSVEDAAKHRDLNNLRMQHKGTVFKNMMRVII